VPNPTPATVGDTTQDTIPDLSQIPRATPLPPATPPDTVSWDADTQSEHDNVYLLAGNVEVHYRDHILRADTISYNKDTGELTADGHLHLSGGENDEYLTASHGTYNLRAGTGRFYDVTGSIGLHGAAATPEAPGRTGLVTPNPFLFSGRIVVKTGPRTYDIYDGSVTSCLLPRPDWLLTAGHLSVDEDQARAKASVFHLMGIPLLFLPYVTHPVDSEQRQSGILIPVLGQSSSKGWIVGEQYYLALGRSADLTMGLQYYSLRGWAESATFRGKGAGDDVFQAHFSALQDRGYTPSGGTYTNQGGEDVTAAFRKQLAEHTRLVGDGEYLSSYVYREAFTENFNQAVSSDITSIGYLTFQNNGLALNARADRYQGLKRVPINTSPGEEVHILHVPSLDESVIDHPFGPLRLSFTGSAAGLKRSQPDFTSSGITERLDLRPEISLPLSGDGWHILASLAGRETFYSRSRAAPYAAGQPPVELTTPLNRADIDLQVDLRPPAIERTFEVPASLQKFFGTEVRHTVEPEITYRNVHGINNFLSILRFDDVDLAADTDQLEYGVTQRLYFRPKPKPVKNRPNCPAVPSASADGIELSAAQTPPELPDVLNPSPDQSTDANGIPDASAEAPQAPTRTDVKNDPCAKPAAPQQQEWFSWRLTQAYFFDPTFGHAVITSRRNIFDSTLDLSGVAFLTEPRNISPLISRARLRTSGHTDIGWDFDYDTGAKKFTSSNVYMEARANNLFGGISFASLNAPGRFATETIDTNDNDQETLVTSPTSNFKQMRVLGGFGDPNRPGLAVAANAGLDLNLGSIQYAAIQTSYNWNCCGLSVEYRKYELGAVRNENAYRFNFTLANIGSAGNLRRAERIF
jgi:LPS-assembly protein